MSKALAIGELVVSNGSVHIGVVNLLAFRNLGIFALAGGLCLLIAFLTLNKATKLRELRPDSPSFSAPAERSWSSQAMSSVSLDVVVTPSALQTLVERLVPTQEVGSQQEDLGRAIAKEQLSWNLERTPITLSTVGRLSASAQIAGQVRVAGVFRPIRGDVGKLLGGATDIPFSQSARIQGQIEVVSKPALTAYWRVHPNVSAAATISNATLLIAKTIPVSISGEVDRHVQRELNNQVAQINEDIADNPFLEKAIKGIHERFCQDHEIDVSGTSAWLKITPVSWSARQPILDQEGLRLGFGLQLQTSLDTQTPSGEKNCNFPEDLTMAPAASPGEVTLKLQTRIEWERIKDAVNTRLLAGDRNVEANSVDAVKIDSLHMVELHASGSSLMMKLQFEGSLDSWWDRKYSGHVWLKANPELDSDNQTLSFRQIELDIDSQATLLENVSFGLIASKLLTRQFENLEPISLDAAGKEASAMATASIAELVSDLKVADVDVLSELTVDSHLEQLHISESGLELLIIANGQLALQVNDIHLE